VDTDGAIEICARNSISLRASSIVETSPVPQPIRTLAFCGSLRKGSYNRLLLKNAIALAPKGMSIEEGAIGELPLYNADLHQSGFPPVVQRLIDQARRTDAFLFVTPEYNYSIPAPLKNAIDWVSRPQPQPFAGRPAAIMGASTGLTGTARSQLHLRHSMVFLDMHPVNKPEVLLSQAQAKFDPEGRLTDQIAVGLIRDLLAALAAWTLRLKALAPVD
jgi:chromate reductase, NAD(P)H dehydrogenase (quinone)